MDTRFHCVYLLTSLDPQCDGDYYIGYTVDPLRRVRQHNGELVHGARRTSRRGRPWQLVCCVSGFTEDRTALKFEWCWQHPRESVRLRDGVRAALDGLRRLPYAVGVLHLLRHAALFARLPLTLHLFDAPRFEAAAATALGHAQRRGAGGAAAAGLPPLLEGALFHIETLTHAAFQQRYLAPETSALLQLPPEGTAAAAGDGGPSRHCYYTQADYLQEAAREAVQSRAGLLPCSLCGLPLPSVRILRCACAPRCPLRCHVTCLAMWWWYHAGSSTGEPRRSLVPQETCGCPLCGETLHWAALVHALKQRAVAVGRLEAERRRAAMETRLRDRLAGMQPSAAARRGRKRPREGGALLDASTLSSSGVGLPLPSSRGEREGEEGVEGKAGQTAGDHPPQESASLLWTAFDVEEWLQS